MLKGSHKRAQTVLEYATLFTVIVAALIAMNIYLRRSFQGRYRELADEVGTQYAPGATFIDHSTFTATATAEYRLGEDHEIPVTDTESITAERRFQEVIGYRR